MKIKNILVYGEDKKFTEGEVLISDGKFIEIGSQVENDDSLDAEIIDGEGCYMIPGLIDIHFHGCVGADFCDAELEALQKMANYELSVGVTSICPASMTIPEEELHKAMKIAGEYENSSGARFVGVNMEGPFISVKKKGAQAPENIRECDVNLFNKLQEEAKGRIKLVDIAPEENGAIDFVKEVKDKVVVSIAHTVADYDTSMKVLEAGASHVTHLYNAMPPFNHREPGVIGAARDCDNCHVELICDGIHIHPAVIRATFAMFGEERVILISDSMRATGMEDGTYTLGGQDVIVRGNLATLEDGTIAGSATNLMDCMRFAVREAGIPLETAVGAATMNPAKEIGIFGMCGSISKGKVADFIILDKQLQIVGIYKNGINVQK